MTVSLSSIGSCNMYTYWLRTMYSDLDLWFATRPLLDIINTSGLVGLVVGCRWKLRYILALTKLC